MTFTIPRRQGAETYTMHGEEVYKATGRPVDQKFGTHTILRIVDDAEAFAASVEAEGDEQAGNWPKSRRHIGEWRRDEAYRSAEKIRAQGTYREVRTVEWDAEHARRNIGIMRAGPRQPGVRYEIAEITEMRHCPLCHRPAFRADGQWRHHTGNYPIRCDIRLPRLPEPEPQPGEWTIDRFGALICGYCCETITWPQQVLGYWNLTGVHGIGLHVGGPAAGVPGEPGDLVVLAEAANLTGGTVMLPHGCEKIPAELYDKYRQDIEGVLAERNST